MNSNYNFVLMRYIIYSYLENFEFPLREANRKQIWWTALDRKEKGYNVEIVLFTSIDKIEYIEGIKIEQRKSLICRINRKEEIIHWIVGSVTFHLLYPFFINKKAILTLTDGDMFGYNKKLLRRFITKLLPIFYDEINVFTKFQKKRLRLNKVNIVYPTIREIKKPEGVLRTKSPSLLYMGHLSRFKGFEYMIVLFKALVEKHNDLIWIIANNSIRGELDIQNEILLLKEQYPNNIILKGIVDPLVEMSQAWVYLYLFKEPIGTMAFALSLYEAEVCETPYVAFDIGGNNEFFKREFLIKPYSVEDLINKVSKIINERKNTGDI